jgi:hypothetical protein
MRANISVGIAFTILVSCVHRRQELTASALSGEEAAAVIRDGKIAGSTEKRTAKGSTSRRKMPLLWMPCLKMAVLEGIWVAATPMARLLESSKFAT